MLIDSAVELLQSFSPALRPAVEKLIFVTEIMRILAGSLTESFKDSGRTQLNGPINLSVVSSTGNIEGKC